MKVIYSFFVFLLFSTVVFGKILRVGYSAVPGINGVDFTTFKAAYDVALNSDTIYVFPGSTLSSGGWSYHYNNYYQITIAKKLFIFSKGSWLDSAANPKGNSDLQATKGSASFGGRVYMQPGSEGSVISGFSASNFIFIQTNNITVKRNFDIIIYLDNNNIEKLIVESNYRIYIQGNDNIENICRNIIIRNNFIYQFLLPSKSYDLSSIENNTWAYDRTGAANGGPTSMTYFSDIGYQAELGSRIDLKEGRWLFNNNLIVFNTFNQFSYFQIIGGTNTVFNYNVRLQSSNEIGWPGTGSGNINIPIADVTNVFEAFPLISNLSADARYRLKAGSPANKANRPGSDSDAGMFGGNNPYKLSTIPSIPTIYKIRSDQGNSPTGNTIQINISTRSNN